MYVLLIDVNEVNLYWEAGPLTVLKYLDHVIDVVHQSGRDDGCLVKHLRKLDCRLTSQECLLLLFSHVDGQGFEEECKRLQLHR